MVEALRPEIIINYSQTPDNIFAKYTNQGIRVAQIENYMQAAKARAAREVEI